MSRNDRQTFAAARIGVLMATALVVNGCSTGGGSSSAPPPAQSAPQTYLAPFMVGTSIAGLPSTVTIDDTAQTFSQSTFLVQANGQVGTQVYYSGSTASTPPLARGLLGLGTEYTYTANGGSVTHKPALTGGWAVELPGQAGGLIALESQPVLPLVAATNCPSSATPQAYQFVTLPGLLLANNAGLGATDWDATSETAYGSVNISGDGTNITFDNIQQFTLPTKVGGTPGTPANPAVSPTTGSCSPTSYGNTISVPGQVTITDPGNGETELPQAIIGVNPAGLLVESNGNGTGTTTPLSQNVLGAGTGAIGLLKPSSAVDTSALVAAQYQGFFYGSGGSASTGSWSTYVASFGFSTVPTTCKTVATQTSTMIYGGDFTSNNPGIASNQNAGGLGNRCDVAIDFGTEDPANNGLYPSAIVYVSPTYAGNNAGAKYSFPAVAIAGQINGKYVIFLVGVDNKHTPNEGWGIYLLQSN